MNAKQPHRLIIHQLSSMKMIVKRLTFVSNYELTYTVDQNKEGKLELGKNLFLSGSPYFYIP